MKLINRWGLMRNTRNENISEHSLETAVIAHALAIIHNRIFGGNCNAERCALLGIFHDVSEIITGDLPTPVKYHSSELREAYRIVETNAEQKLISMLPPELRPDYTPLIAPDKSGSEEESLLWKFVRAADKISALIKCAEERSTGNMDFKTAEKSTLETIKKLNCVEANYFLSEFMDGFDLTLDAISE